MTLRRMTHSVFVPESGALHCRLGCRFKVSVSASCQVKSCRSTKEPVDESPHRGSID